MTQMILWMLATVQALWFLFFFFEKKIRKFIPVLDDLVATSVAGIVMLILAIISPIRNNEFGLHHSLPDALKTLATLAGLLFIVFMGEKMEALEIIRVFLTNSKRKNHHILSWTTFFLSMILDNVASCAAVIKIQKSNRPESDATTNNSVPASNYGGGGSPIGDSTTIYGAMNGLVHPILVLWLTIPAAVGNVITTFLCQPRDVEVHFNKTDLDQRNPLPLIFLIATLLLVPVLFMGFGWEPWQASLTAAIVMFSIYSFYGRSLSLDLKSEYKGHGEVNIVKGLYLLIRPATFMALVVFSSAQLAYAGAMGILVEYLVAAGAGAFLIAIMAGFLSKIVDNMAVVVMAAYGFHIVYPHGDIFWYYLILSAGTAGSSNLPASSAGATLKKLTDERVTALSYFLLIGWKSMVGWIASMLVLLLMHAAHII